MGCYWDVIAHKVMKFENMRIIVERNGFHMQYYESILLLFKRFL